MCKINKRIRINIDIIATANVTTSLASVVSTLYCQPLSFIEVTEIFDGAYTGGNMNQGLLSIPSNVIQ